MPTQILIVDDNPDDREAIQRALRDADDISHPLLEAEDEPTCLGQLERHADIDCVILDYSMPGHDGLHVLDSILASDSSRAVVMITGRGDEHIAVQAMKRGALDYVAKDAISGARLHQVVSSAMERAALQRRVREQRESLENFARIVVHDVRAPLRSIEAAINMLIEDLPPDVAAAHSDLLDVVGERARRMKDLIAQLHAYTRADGAVAMDEPVDLAAQARAVCADIAADIERAGARVQVDGALPTVSGNATQIAQLLQNLIANGIKYNRSTTPEIRISVRDEGSTLAIAVSDNGIGIEARFLSAIFDPFRRLHAQGEFEGSGLGLATCRKIAERHGGTLSCRSKPGKGSVFTLRLPKCPVAPTANERRLIH